MPIELADYEPVLITLHRKFNQYFSGRGMIATFSANHQKIASKMHINDVDYYYSLSNKKRRLFYQTKRDNLESNLLRVGVFGFLDRAIALSASLSQIRLTQTSLLANLKGASQRNGHFGMFRGTGMFIFQFYFGHMMAATISQEKDSSNRFVQINPVKYLSSSLAFNLMLFPVNFARHWLYYSPSSNIEGAVVAMGDIINNPKKVGSFLKGSAQYSLGMTLLVPSLAFLGSQDVSPLTLGIIPLTLMYHRLAQNYSRTVLKSLDLPYQTKSVLQFSNLSKSLFAVGVLVNLFAGFRFAGMASHERILEDYVKEHEVLGETPDYLTRTRHFFDVESFNRNK